MRRELRIVLLAFFFIAATAGGATLKEARDLFEQRRLPQARAAFESLARNGPIRAEANFYLGRIAFIEADTERAAEFFEKAMELDPASGRYAFWFGRALGDMAQKSKNPFKQASLAKKVQHAFETAVKRQPSLIEGHLGLIDFYLIAPRVMGGGDEKAKAQIAEIERIDPAMAHLARARMHRRAEKPELALQEYEAAAKRFPRDPRPRIWLSSYYVGQKNFESAARAAGEAIQLGADYLPGHYQVGYVAAASGRNLEAGEKSLQRYLVYVPKDDEPPVTMAHYQLGLIYEKLGRKEEAKQQFRETVRRAPLFKEAAEALARVNRS